jgi:hypothetical protein
VPSDNPSGLSSRTARVWGIVILVVVLVTGIIWAVTGATSKDGLSGLGRPTSQAASKERRKPPAPTCERARFAPACGSALWGIYTLQGATPATAVTDLEAKVGRKFDLTARYHDFSEHPELGIFPDASERELGKDRTLLMSWQARDGVSNTDLKWADVADGTYDSYIHSAATRLKAWRRPVIIAFDAEFDKLTDSKGPVKDYVRAYRHIVNTFRRDGVKNVAWAWVPTGYLRGDNPVRTFAGYPGDAYVDWIGFDPFNFFGCNATPWMTFEQKIKPMYDWLLWKGLGNKPFLLSEYGTQYDADHPARSTRWYSEIPGVVARYPNLRGLVRFDAEGVISSGAQCDLWLDNGPGMLEAFARAGHAAVFKN